MSAGKSAERRNGEEGDLTIGTRMFLAKGIDMVMVVSTRDLMGAARGGFFDSGVDGLSFSDNWDSMPLSDLDEALDGVGVGASSESSSSATISVPALEQATIKPRSLLSKGRRG